MRMSKTHKVVVSTVVTTIATATVLTFTRADTAPAGRIASLPQSSSDSPVVEGSTPGATTEPTPTKTAAAPKPSKTPKPVAEPVDQPSTPATRPVPTTEPAPSPSPTPRPKSLVEVLLGQ